VLISVSHAAKASAQIRAGSITEIHGLASVQRNGQTNPAALATAIMEGDKIATADRASVTVALIDGSRLTLSESSSMVIYRAKVEPALAGLANQFFVKLFNGTLGSVVTPVGGRAKQFEVPFAEAYLDRVDLERRQVRMKLPEGLLEVNAPLTAEEKREQAQPARRKKR